MSADRSLRPCPDHANATVPTSRPEWPPGGIRGLKTTAQFASEFQVHPVQISQWKRQALDHLPEAFGRDISHPQRSESELTAPLFEEIGRLEMERDWLKKSLPRSREAKAMLFEPRHPDLSVARPCVLLDLCVFHAKVDTDSTASWTPIPGQAGHLK